MMLLSEQDFNNGVAIIKESILDFDYDSTLAKIKDIGLFKRIIY